MERTLSKNWKQWLRWESRLGQGFVCFKMVETWASLFFYYYYFWLHHIAWRILVLLKVVQLCPTLCNLMGYAVHGILQARILEWVAVCFSRDLSNPGIEPRSPAFNSLLKATHTFTIAVSFRPCSFTKMFVQCFHPSLTLLSMGKVFLNKEARLHLEQTLTGN